MPGIRIYLLNMNTNSQPTFLFWGGIPCRVYSNIFDNKNFQNYNNDLRSSLVPRPSASISQRIYANEHYTLIAMWCLLTPFAGIHKYCAHTLWASIYADLNDVGDDPHC